MVKEAARHGTTLAVNSEANGFCVTIRIALCRSRSFKTRSLVSPCKTECTCNSAKGQWRGQRGDGVIVAQPPRQPAHEYSPDVKLLFNNLVAALFPIDHSAR